MFNARRIAIDLGTSNIIVADTERGILINEPTVVAVATKEKRVIAVGEEAKAMLGRVPEDLEARKPIKGGGISNYSMTEAMLRRMIDKAIGRSRIVRPEVIIAVPYGLSSVEERAVSRALSAAGAGKIYLLPAPVAAAVGAKMPIHSSNGSFIVDIGGGTTSIGLLSLNGIVQADSLRIGGDAINEAIIDYLKKKKHFLIGENMAEKLKIDIGSALETDQNRSVVLNGVDSKSGQPVSLEVTADELVQPIRNELNKIISRIQTVLSKSPPDLVADIVDNGIVLSGGGALLSNVDVLLTRAISVPAHIIDEPQLAVVRGLLSAIDNIDLLRRNINN